jgi:creatinine amidohydrolase
VAPEASQAAFNDPGDHAGELETSLVLHLKGELVEMHRAGDGRRVPFSIEKVAQPGIWTPRPWSQSHPDTGCGDPRQATREKGEAFFQAVSIAVADMLVNVSAATKGQSPYLGPHSASPTIAT